MNYPYFFNEIKTIKLQDKLSAFLGVNDDGIVEFSYLDVVKSAGHSCPTVAGAYLLCLVGLKELYKDEIPQRGEIKVYFKEDEMEGVSGVISNVVSQITGATCKNGFKGINGNFIRHSLVSFNEPITSSIKLERLDTNNSVEITYNPSKIPPNPEMSNMMKKIQQKIATKNDKKLFAKLWQQRVENIFDNISLVISI